MSKARKLLVIGLSAIFFYAAVAADKKHTIFAVHSENAKYVLYSAQGKAGSFASDHLLWAKIKATGKVRLAVPHELFGPRAGVWSAVLSRKNPDMAYVVADSELPSSRDSNKIFEVDLARQTVRLLPFPEQPWVGIITADSIVISDDGLFLAFQAEVASIPDTGVATAGIVKFGPVNSSNPKLTILFRDQGGWPRFTRDGKVVLFEPCFDKFKRLLDCKTRKPVR